MCVLTYDLCAVMDPEDEKTLKWIPIFVLFVVVWFIIDIVSGNMLSDTSYSEDLIFPLSDTILVVYDLVIQIGSIALVVYSCLNGPQPTTWKILDINPRENGKMQRVHRTNPSTR